MPPVRRAGRSGRSHAGDALRGVRPREGVRGAPAGRGVQEIRRRSGAAPRRARSPVLETCLIAQQPTGVPMKISMYQACVPPFSRALGNLATILEKAAAYAEAKKIDQAVLIGSRLYPDMFPLSRQVQIASDSAKGGASRLAQVEPPKYEDNEATFAELAARCRKT